MVVLLNDFLHPAQEGSHKSIGPIESDDIVTFEPFNANPDDYILNRTQHLR